MTTGGHSTERGSTVIFLRGDHDLSTVPSLTEELTPFTASGDADVVLDLSELSFLDASTVGVIVEAEAHLRSQSRSLSVRNPAAFVRRVLDLCGVTHLVEPAQWPARPNAAAALGSWVAVPPTEPVAGVEPGGTGAGVDLAVEDPDPVSTGRR